MNWLRRMMYGRYGGRDQLNSFLFGVFVVSVILQTIISLIYRFTGLKYFTVATVIFSVVLMIFRVLQYISVIIFIFRAMSRNFSKRQAENEKFLKFWYPVQDWFEFARKKSQAKKSGHTLFRCPSCKKQIRVPSGRGRIEITCPACREKFIRKS